MENLEHHLAAAAQAVEAELSKFDHLQVVQSKLAELKSLLADLAQPTGDPNNQPEA